MFRTLRKQIPKDLACTLTAGKKTIDWNTFKSALKKNGFPERIIRKVERKKRLQKRTYSVVCEELGTIEKKCEEKVKCRGPPDSMEEAVSELSEKCKTDTQYSSLVKTLEEMGLVEIETDNADAKGLHIIEMTAVIPLGIAISIWFLHSIATNAELTGTIASGIGMIVFAIYGLGKLYRYMEKKSQETSHEER